jgi:DNA polymerase-3 subunit gamma/tau
VTLAEDGQSLELMFHSLSAYNYFAREEQKQQLVQLIEERTGLTVNLIVTKLEDAQDFQNRFTDIRESVNMDIEVDDKEEFI